MSVVGIISEYNPFHDGHKYHLENARNMAQATACVCVMSSNFVQRGEPSVINKWARAEMALRAGADLVIELPSALSCASAEYFASGAISLLDATGVVDYVCFGSEEGSLEQLSRAADILAFESDELKTCLRKYLDQGLSFAAARQKAIEEVVEQTEDKPREGMTKDGHMISKPNNILGIEYIKAIKRMGSSLMPITLQRIGQGYNSKEKAARFSSATAIRKYLSDVYEAYTKKNDEVWIAEDYFLRSNLPLSSLEVISREFSKGRGPVFPEAFQNLLLHLLRTTPNQILSQLPYMEDGLENRLYEAALDAVSFSDLVSSAVTVRYPASRIKRILMALLTGMSEEFLEALKNNGYGQYIRVLGFNEAGQRLLSTMKKRASLPIITKAAGYRKLLSPLAAKLFEHEVKAADTYVLGYPSPHARAGRSEFTTSPVRL